MKLFSISIAFSLCCNDISQAGREEEDCSFHISLSRNPEVSLRQSLSEDYITMALTFEGLGWIGVGFNQDGNMVGSTVVIGFPDKPITSLNPSRYYLGSKSDLNQVDRVDVGDVLVDVQWRDPKPVVYGSEPKPVVYTGKEKDEDDGEDWKRSLIVPGEQHRILEVYNSTIQQNETHTMLVFTRPLTSKSEYMTSIHPNDLNTLIWAAGSSNKFGYHGSKHGSYSLSFTTCSHGGVPLVGEHQKDVRDPSFAPSASPSHNTSLEPSQMLNMPMSSKAQMLGSGSIMSTRCFASTVVLVLFSIFILC